LRGATDWGPWTRRAPGRPGPTSLRGTTSSSAPAAGRTKPPSPACWACYPLCGGLRCSTWLAARALLLGRWPRPVPAASSASTVQRRWSASTGPNGRKPRGPLGRLAPRLSQPYPYRGRCLVTGRLARAGPRRPELPDSTPLLPSSNPENAQPHDENSPPSSVGAPRAVQARHGGPLVVIGNAPKRAI
jgi:hypothetical protein